MSTSNPRYNELTQPILIKYQLIATYVLLSFCVFAYLNLDNEVLNIIQSSVADAYIAVSSFVAGTLLIFYSLEKFLNFDIGVFLKKHPKLEIVGCSFLGALPGCGGAIIVMTQYTRGKISFGSVVATLTATMGDAAFLLIAKKPLIGLFVLLTGFFVGIVSGILVNLLHGKFFLKLTGCQVIKRYASTSKKYKQSKNLENLWLFFMLPGILIGILSAFQIDLNSIFTNRYVKDPVLLFGFIAGSLCFFMWLLPLLHGYKIHMSDNNDTLKNRTISDTNFVTGWVILAFLAFELSVYFSKIDLSIIFNTYLYFVPLISILIGLLPGCGPQILVTTMYLSGVIPLSAQLGNAISNDGDALFPAIAIHPKAALIATLYSAVPAFIVSYLYLFIFEANIFWF